MTRVRAAAAGIIACIVLSQAASAGTVERDPGTAKPEDAPKLIETLRSATASPFEKARACQNLSVIGGKEAVAALAALLPDEKLGNYARCGLENIPDPSADAALREALGKVKGPLLAGVVNSIGVRRDAQAVSALIALARDPASGVAEEALLSLGRIGTAEAVDAVRTGLAAGVPAIRAAAGEGLLYSAEVQLAQGKKDAAVALYEAVRAADVPKPVAAAAMRGILVTQQAAALPLLVTQLNSTELIMRDVAFRALRDMPDAKVTQALIAELPKAKPELQCALVIALAERNDPAALAAIQPLATGGAANVQREAVKALGKIGDKASVAVLVKLLQAGDGASDVAYASLRQMTAPDTDAAIMELAPAADAAVRVKLIDLLGMRAAAGAAGLLLKMAADADQATSSAAFQALSSVARPGDVPELIKLLAACKDEGAQEAARGALFAACMKTPNAEQRDAAVLAAYEEAKDSGFKCSLIKILGAIRTAKACEVIKKALSAGDEQVRDTALRTLANWPDASPVAALMEAVKGKSTDVHRVLALRGAARMAGLLAASAERDTPRVTELFKELGQAVKSDDDKKLFLSALANLTNVEGLTMLQPFLGDAAVQAEAETALVAMTGSPAMDYKPAKAKELAKAALEKVAASGKSSAARKKAAEIAKRIPAQ